MRTLIFILFLSSISLSSKAQLCQFTDSLNLTTGVNPAGGGLISTGTVDPLWKLVNIPVLPSAPPPIISVPDVYAINYYQTSWNTIPNSRALSPNNVPNFGINNVNASQPWRIRRSFCLNKAENITIEGVFRADDQGTLKLYNAINGTMLYSQGQPNAPNSSNFFSDTPVNASLYLQPGTYYLEMELLNVSSVAMGFAFRGSVKIDSGIRGLSNNNIEGANCCNIGFISGKKVIDNDCNGIYNQGDQVGSGWQFNLIDNSTSTVVATAFSDLFGDFFFNGVQSGSYTVEEVQQPNTYCISPTGGSTVVSVTVDSISTVEFFNCVCSMSTGVIGTNLACFGDNSGRADAQPTNGDAPYKYVWSNGGSTKLITGLSGGAYTVTVTDTNNCRAVRSVLLQEPNPIICNVSVNSHVTVYGGNDGSASVLVGGGSGGYTYLWDSNAGSQTTVTATGLYSGTFVVTVTDSNGCPAVCNVTILDGIPPCALCENDSLNISTGIDSITGALLPIGTIDPLWKLVNIPVLPSPPPPIISVPNAFIINYFQTNWNTIPNTRALSPRNIPNFGINNVNLSQPWRFRRSFCLEEGKDVILGGVFRADDQGTLNLYRVNNATPLFTQGQPNAPNTNNFNRDTPFADTLYLSAGSYYFEMELINRSGVAMGYALGGRIKTLDGTPLLANGGSDCCGSGYISGKKIIDNDCNGIFSTGDQVGVGWEFNLIDNSTSSIVATTTTDAAGDFFFNDVEAGDYTVEEVIQSGYYPLSPVGGSQVVQVIVGSVVTVDFFNCPCPVSATIVSPGIRCWKDSNGTLDLSVSGGQSPYTFLWSNGAVTEDLVGLQPGVYSVTITDSDGCEQVASAAVTEPDPLTCFVRVDKDVTMIGGSDGEATSTPQGGSSPFTYQWDMAAGSQTTATAVGLSTGYYLITVTDKNNCTNTCSVFIGEPDPKDCPDLTPVTTLVPGNIQGSSSIEVSVNVNEVNGNDTDGSAIIVRVPSDPRLVFAWNPALPTAAGTTLDNMNWNYLGDNGIVHTWRFIGPGVLIAGNGSSPFGFEGTYDPQSTDGQTTLTATIIPFSGGECNLTNNADSERLVYFE